jgi:CubicO group peptidase (beta-lactamase class C family)
MASYEYESQCLWPRHPSGPATRRGWSYYGGVITHPRATLTMDWHRATAVASGIAARWTTEGGPGGAILLFDADEIRAEACGGLASLELGVAFTAETATRYASISKHFFGALVLRLCDAGVLALDDALGAHLPGLSPALAAVTLGRALDMTSGLPDVMETQWLLGVPWTAGLDRHALLRFACRLDALNYQPGSEISYTNTGYRLIEAALALQSQPVNAALHQHFFAPLALSIRLTEDETEPVPGLATGYWRNETGWRRGRYGLNFSASGGLAGSARDLVVWLQALLGGHPPAGGLLARLGARRHLADGRPTGMVLASHAACCKARLRSAMADLCPATRTISYCCRNTGPALRCCPTARTPMPPASRVRCWPG